MGKIYLLQTVAQPSASTTSISPRTLFIFYPRILAQAKGTGAFFIPIMADNISLRLAFIRIVFTLNS